MDVQASPITRAVLDHLPVLEFLRANGAAHATAIAQATGRVPSNVRRDLPKLVEGGLLTRTPAEGDEGAVDAYALDASATLALEAMDRARNTNLSAGAADGAVSMGAHSEFDRNPDQPRKKFKQEKLEQLADTIEAVGVLEPILVWPPNDAGVKIIWAGERRWRAVGIVNQRHDDPNRVRIPYVTRAPSEEEKAALIAEAAELALIENGQGEDLTSFEKAKALRSMVPSRYPSARAAAKVIGVHEKTAQDWLRALAELPAGVLKRWEDDELGWREVRDILRPTPVKPAPMKEAEADPAQIDIEEVTGTTSAPSQQVPLSLRSDTASAAAIEEARLAALVEYFTEEVEEAALAIERAKPGHANFQAANLSGKTTIEGEAWPAEPVEVLRTPWDGYPSAEIRLYASDKGRWAFNLSTAQGGPTYSGSGDAYGVRTCDKLFRSRHDVLTFARARIVRQLGDWAKKRKLQDWLAELTSQVSPIAEAAQSAAQAHMDALVNGFSEKLELTLVEVEDKACRDPKVITNIKGKRTEGWAALSEKPAGGAMATLIERKLLETDNIGDQWFARVVPTSEGAAWLEQHDLAGGDAQSARASRLYQLRAKIMGENVATQLAGQRLRYATSCLNTVRPEDIETAQLLRDSQGGTDRKLAEIDRRKVDGLSARDILTVVEVAHALVNANAMPEGFLRAAKVHDYWLDARVGRLKDLRLIGFWNAGGEDGWVVQAGEALPDWLEAEGYDFGHLGKEQLERAQGAGGQAGWPGPGYVTPWLNAPSTATDPEGDGEDVVAEVECPSCNMVFDTATGDELCPACASEVAAGASDDDEGEDEVAQASAQALLGRVVDHIVEPASFGELLRAAGLVLPLRVSANDVGVINDANGTSVLTVDQDRALPDALVAARALLIAAAVNAHDIGRELTDRAPASVVEPEKMTPALMRKSIYPDHLVCLEDGRRFTDLTHHLRVEHDMEWGEYLARWKLPRDYPAVAPATSEERERTAIDNARAVLRGTL